MAEKPTVPKIKESSKYDGLTLEQMSQIRGILANRISDSLSKAEIGQINEILSAPGTASAAMGAVWTPLSHDVKDIVEVPDRDESTQVKTSRGAKSILSEANALGVVTFSDLTAMARTDYGENGSIDPRYLSSRADLKKRAVVFAQYTQKQGETYKRVFAPIQVHKQIEKIDGKAAVDRSKSWVYEPWSQAQFVSGRDAVKDSYNRTAYRENIPYAMSSDISLNRWLENQPLSRKQHSKLLRESGLGVIEDNNRAVIDSLNLSRKVAESADAVMSYLTNNGFTHELEVQQNGRLTARVNTGSGTYQVNVLDFQRPYETKGIGNVMGEGLSVYVNRQHGGRTAKQQFIKNHGIGIFDDPTGPLRVITGQSDIKDVAFNVEGLNTTHDDYVKGTGLSSVKTSVVYSAAARPFKKNPESGKMVRQHGDALVEIARNSLVLDSDEDSKVSLDEMVKEVNSRLEDAGLEPVVVDKEDGYANLPLAAISQLYSRETVISALLAKGIDAEALRDPKYDADVHLVLSDLEPLSPEAFSDENVDRVEALVHEEDLDGSIRKMALDDIRLLKEISDEKPDVLAAADREFKARIGFVEENTDRGELDEEQDLLETVNNEAADEKNIDTMIVPLKESLMTSMAGRYATNEKLHEHIVKPEDQSETEKRWVASIREKIASRVGIRKPKSSNNKKAMEKYQEQLKRVRVALDDQHVVHWAVTEPGSNKMSKNPVSGKNLQGSVGQLFLPDKDGLIELDYTGGSKGHAVAGYNAYFVSAEEQLLKMQKENYVAEKFENKPKPWSKEEMDLKFLRSEDSLAYRIRLSGFDEELDKRLDQMLTRQVTLGIDDSLGDNVMLNRLYKGKDTYLTRITNDLVLSDKKLIKHLASRVYMDDSYFSDAGNQLLGRHVDENGELLDLAAKYTPESLSGTMFDETNIAGLGNSHFLSEGALELMQNPDKYKAGRFIEHFREGSDYQKMLALAPHKRFGLMMNWDSNKYHYGDPTDRVSMAGNQQVHADSYVQDTHLALMTFKGYTMDDGSLITEKYAERVGREQAEMVAQVRAEQGDLAYLQDQLENPMQEKEFSSKSNFEEALKKQFIDEMGTKPTTEGGYKLSNGDKLSTFHGNKTTISHIISEAEMQPGQEFEVFAENPDLEVVMPPESILSRLNMGEVQQLMDGDVKPVTYNGQTIGWQGTTEMINTEIKASHKTHAYGRGDGRHVGAQLLWMINARKNSDVIIDEIYGKNGKAAMALVNYMELTGVSVDPETGTMSQGIAHKDADLADETYCKEHMVTVIDPSKKDPANALLPKNGGYIKLPIPVHLPNMKDGEKTSYLPVLPEALRQGQELPSGKIIEQDQTRKYNQIVRLIQEGRGEDVFKSRRRGDEGTPILQSQVSSLAAEITRSKLGAADGSANKVSHTRRNVMGATVEHSATAAATNNPKLPLDTIEVGPDVYETLALEHPDQKVLMWRDPALHAGSVMAFNVKLNPKISGVGMNPVIATPFGGDFDGDTYGIYAPRYSEKSQKVLEEEYSVEAYLRDMGKNPSERTLVQTDVELNTGMDFTAGAVASGLVDHNGKTMVHKKDLEAELQHLIETGAAQEKSDISGDITKLWQASQAGNIGADNIDLRTRETVLNSMIGIAAKGAKGKVEVDEEGKVTNLKGIQNNLDRFDRLGYYNGLNKNRLFDHDQNGKSIQSAEIRNGAQNIMKKRYAEGYVDGRKKVKIAGNEKSLSSVAQADRDIEKATVAKQQLTASSGQMAIDLNKTAADIEDKSISARISENTQVVTQAALQVKHESALVPFLSKGLNMMSGYTTKGGESYADYQKNRQDVFETMQMADGYSSRFAEAAYESAAENPLYGDTFGALEDVGQKEQETQMNVTRSKAEVTEASAPIALLAYNGATYLKQLAEKKRSLYEGAVSGQLVQALPSAYNQKHAAVDQIDDKSAEVTTEYFRQHKRRAQKANREVRDKSFAMGKPLVKPDDLAKIIPENKDIKTVVKNALETIRNADVKAYEDQVDLETAVSAQIGTAVKSPSVDYTRQDQAKTREASQQHTASGPSVAMGR